jgi:hypothetical protein
VLKCCFWRSNDSKTKFLTSDFAEPHDFYAVLALAYLCSTLMLKPEPNIALRLLFNKIDATFFII